MSTERGRSMLIQRRPGASTISTRGSSESGVASTTARERRPNGLRGRLGMPETERLVGRRHQAWKFIGPGQVFATLTDYIAGRIQRGGGTGPMKPRQPGPVTSRDKVAIPSGSKTNGLGDAVQGFPGFSRVSLRRTTGRRNRPDAGRCPEVQGVLNHLSARGALRLRAVLWSARGRLLAA